MGGSVSVESQVDQGSVFHINFKTEFKIVPMDIEFIEDKKTFIHKLGPSLEIEFQLNKKIKKDALKA